MALKSIFSIHGVPKSIMADNMPFTSHVMKQFGKDWCFDIVTSSPHHHQSNGLAERYVQTVKQFLRKCEQSQFDVYHSLLVYRETPLSGCLYSPAEMPFRRNLRTGLPTTTAFLTLNTVNSTGALKARQQTAKAYYDQRTKELPNIPLGSEVFMRAGPEQIWTPGCVVGHHGALRSYLVDNGSRILRRNRVHLKPNNTIVRPSSELDSSSPTDTEELPNPNLLTPVVSDQEVKAVTPTGRVVPPIGRQGVRSSRGVLPSRFKDFDMN